MSSISGTGIVTQSLTFKISVGNFAVNVTETLRTGLQNSSGLENYFGNLDRRAIVPNKPQKIHQSPLCNTEDAVSFVKRFLPYATTIADELGVPVENILGLAAQESQWGSGRIASTYNNYFSMRAPAPYQNGESKALGDPNVRVAHFINIPTCGKSFIDRWGNAVRNVKDPIEFGKALVTAGFNSGNSKTGGRDDFVPYLNTIITNTKIRLGCK
jgi:hypothetical protein